MSLFKSPPSPRARWAGIFALIVANLLHLLAYSKGHDTSPQLVVFVLSLFALPWLTQSRGYDDPGEVGCSPPRQGDGPFGLLTAPVSEAWSLWAPRPRQELLLALAVLGLGFFLRIWRWDSMPVGIWSDELLASINGVRLLENPESAFGTRALVPEWPQWVHTFNLYTYYVTATFKVFGVNHLGIKAISFVPGCLTLLGTYWLLRELGGPRLALLGTLAMDLSRWHLTQSRFEWDATFMVMGSVLGMAAAVRGLRTGRMHWLALSGLAIGLIQFSYLASRLAAVGAALWLGLLFVLSQRGVPGLRKRLFVAGLTWSLAFVVAAGPVLVFTVTHEEVAKARIKQVTLDEEENPQAADITLEDNIRLYLGMFRREGPNNARQNIPDAPMLPETVGLLAGVGALLALRWRQGVGGLMSWAFFVSALAGGVLSDNHGSANAHRVGLVVPVLYTWFALGVDQLLGLLGRLVDPLVKMAKGRKQVAAASVGGAALALVIMPGLVDSQDYFVTLANSKAHWVGVRAAPQLQLAKLLQKHEGTHQLWVDELLDDLTLDLLLWQPPRQEGGVTVGGLDHPLWRRVPVTAQGLLPLPEGDTPVLLAVEASHRKQLSKRWPALKWTSHNDPWGHEMFATIKLTPKRIREMRDKLLKAAVAGEGDVVFTAEELKGKGIIRLIYDRKQARTLVGAYVERPRTLANVPYGPLSRETVRMEWHAWLQTKEEGLYRFSEDVPPTRGELWIDGKLQRLGPRAPGIVLKPGKHSLLFKGSLNTYNRLDLLWATPGKEPEPIPGDALIPRLPRGFKR